MTSKTPPARFAYLLSARAERSQVRPAAEGLLFVALLLLAMPMFASVSVKRSTADTKKIDVAINEEPLSSAVKALELYLPHAVQIDATDDPKATFSARHVDPEAALRAMALSAGVALTLEDDHYVLRKGPSVTLDVKDEEIRLILKSMQEQCGIKNLVIDPDVHGSGTFLFDGVSCRTAFDVVLRTLGLASTDYGNSVVQVGARRR